ncbi:MAG TPA: hypothetical protein DCE14_06040 [Kosmotogaceae bacterium]|nr:hypothetical protein [Kosmotogaceae bacterium]
MPVEKVNGLELYYELHGSGEPVALLNGIFMNTSSWAGQRSLLERHYQVLKHDFRDQQKSGRSSAGYSMETHAKDFKTLLEKLAIEHVHVVGTSYGGEVAMMFTHLFPETVRSLSLITTVSEVHYELELIVKRWIRAAETHDANAFVNEWLADVYSHDFLQMNREILIPRIMSLYEEYDFEAAIRLCRCFLNLVDNPLTPYLGEIHCPVLLIAAEQDAVKPLKYSRIIASEIPAAEFHTVRDAGHALFIEKPEHLNTLLLGFLKKVAREHT